jgi:hypothetical protein
MFFVLIFFILMYVLPLLLHAHNFLHRPSSAYPPPHLMSFNCSMLFASFRCSSTSSSSYSCSYCSCSCCSYSYHLLILILLLIQSTCASVWIILPRSCAHPFLIPPSFSITPFLPSFLPSFLPYSLLCSCFGLMLYSIWRCFVFCSYSYKSRLLLLLTAELSPRSEKPATSLVRRRLSTPKTSLRSSKTTPLKG